jgi:hypothetical protein
MTAPPAPGFDLLGHNIDATSHPTHAMNPIDRVFYAREEWDVPSAHHKFKCMFCGALGGAPLL